MTSDIPPALPTVGLSVPPAQAALAILIQDLTEALASLPAGSRIQATVAQILPQPTPAPGPASPAPPQPSGRLVQLDTKLGPAIVRLPQPPPVGSSIEIAVARPASPQAPPQWRAVNIVPPPVVTESEPVEAQTAAPLPAKAQTAAPLPAQAQTAAPLPAQATAPQRGFPAVLVKPADVPDPLPRGSQIVVRIVDLEPPPTAPEDVEPPPAATASPAPQILPTAAAAQSLPPQPTLAPVSTLPAATLQAIEAPQTPQQPDPTAPAPAATAAAVSVSASSIPVPSVTPAPTVPATVATITPAPTATASAPPQMTAAAPIVAAPQPPPPQQSLPPSLGGTVLPNLDQGRPLLPTPVGLLALPLPPHLLPPGSQVTLAVVEPLPIPPPDIPLGTKAPDPQKPPIPALLDKLVAILQPADPKLAEQVLARIPTPGPHLAAQIAAIAQSLGVEDGMRRWLGEAIAAPLERALPQMAAQIAQHWGQLAQPVAGANGGDWQTAMIPLLFGGHIASLRLTTRRRGTPSERARREAEGTRFLIDVELSRLGPLQLDGLVKRPEKRFDLILRSRERLPGDMRREIDGLFATSLSAFGLKGDVMFQTSGWIATPLPTVTDNGIIFA